MLTVPKAPVLVQGAGDEDHEAVDGDGRADHVEELHGGGVDIEQLAVEAAVVGDGAERARPDCSPCGEGRRGGGWRSPTPGERL